MNKNSAHLTIELKTDNIEGSSENWVHLLPSGEFSARDGRGPWVVSNPETVIEATKSYAGKNQLPIDYEHQIDLSEKNGHPAPAAGWIKALQSRTDGIWGLVNWTDKAKAFLSNKEYKYLSPVINYTNDGKVVRITRAALTNNPALEMTALAKSEESVNTEDGELSEIKTLLGLDDQSDLSDISIAVQQLKTAKEKSTNDFSDYVPLGEFQKVTKELNSINEQTLIAKIDDAVDNNLLPASLKAWGVSMCRHDDKAFDEFLGTISTIFGFMSTCQTDRLTAEERALLGGQTKNTSTNEIYSRLGISQDDIAKYSEEM